MQEYIQQELNRTNAAIYFRNGRWVFHVLLALGVYLAGMLSTDLTDFSLQSVFYVLVWSKWLYAIFYYTYCFYLIPVLFKRNRKTLFWCILVAALLLLPLLELCFFAVTDHLVPVIYRNNTPLSAHGYAIQLLSDTTAFVMLSFLPYVMEVMEDFKLQKAISAETNQRIQNEQRLLKTKMNPQFIMRSLDGIIYLSEEHSTQAPDAVVSFSDVLRYRLYPGSAPATLAGELRQVNNLFRFQNAIAGDQLVCTLETSGNINGLQVPSLILVSFAEELLNTYDTSGTWSLLLYVLAEDNELQIAAELCTGHPAAQEIITAAGMVTEQISGKKCNFNSLRNGNLFSISLCIPSLQNSAA
ncbi:histidine kinase [Chitinophagaceae bacterium MMS25-I14]